MLLHLHFFTFLLFSSRGLALSFFWSSSRLTSDLGSQRPYHVPHNADQNLFNPRLSVGAQNDAEIVLDDNPNSTIYQVLSSNSHFSRLVRLINFSGSDVIDLLNKSDSRLTFFAVPDFALKKRPHGKRPRVDFDQGLPASLGVSSGLEEHNLAGLFAELEYFEASIDVPDEDKEKWKKVLKKIITAVLQYHVVPAVALDVRTLAQNHTYGTAFAFRHALGGEPQRLRVHSAFPSPLLHSLMVNFLAKVVRADVKAKNGIIHVINHPLLPPPTVFQELFLIPDVFSFVTSALQRVGLTQALDLHWVHDKEGKGHLEGISAVTFFAPTNKAFKALPRKLRLFLFSPFGVRALKKLLQYHIVPNVVVHSDHIIDTTKKATDSRSNFLSPHTPSQSGCDDSWDWTFPPSNHDEVAEYASELERQCELPSLGDWGSELNSEYCLGVPLLASLAPEALPFFRPHFPHISPIYKWDLSLSTLLEGHPPMHVHIVKLKITSPLPHVPPRYVSKVLVNKPRQGAGGTFAALSDVVSGNGAVHVIPKVLCPRPDHHRRPPRPDRGSEEDNVDDEWDDWESWLPLWAEED